MTHIKNATPEQIAEIMPFITCVSNQNALFRQEDPTCGYMWTKNMLARSELTPMDIDFLLPDNGFHEKRFCAWHDYGGYWGLFKPSLDEVIGAIYEWWIAEGKPKIYVRTKPWLSSVAASYDAEKDLHLGETEVWWKTARESKD